MLVTMAEMLQEAQKNNYAVPAPNVWNEESTRAALLAAENCKSPVILDYGYIPVHGRKPMVYEYMEYCERWCERSPVPIAINLDHGLQYMHAIACIRAHFTSIMVDRSALPYERNAAEVKELVKIAHSVGVSVEAELGHVGQGKRYDVDGKNNLTDPEEAARFVEETGVDCLAI
ncbi:MAG: class II fructose-bisphosphate aldolase, partial [Clostridiales bacterium]|nr:class II fructose-bisphosphate aldolase [Clostridiales bacterium]